MELSVLQTIAMALVTVAALLVVYKAVDALKVSVPKETLESLQKGREFVNERVEASPTKTDDLIRDISAPLIDAILKVLESKTPQPPTVTEQIGGAGDIVPTLEALK